MSALCATNSIRFDPMSSHPTHQLGLVGRGEDETLKRQRIKDCAMDELIRPFDVIRVETVA